MHRAIEQNHTSNISIRTNGLPRLGEPKLGVLHAALQRVLVGEAGVRRPRDEQAAQRGDRIQVLLAEQIGGIVRDVVVGQAAAALVRPGEHGGGEVALDIEERAEVEQVE